MDRLTSIDCSMAACSKNFEIDDRMINVSNFVTRFSFPIFSWQEPMRKCKCNSASQIRCGLLDIRTDFLGEVRQKFYGRFLLWLAANGENNFSYIPSDFKCNSFSKCEPSLRKTDLKNDKLIFQKGPFGENELSTLWILDTTRN